MADHAQEKREVQGITTKTAVQELVRAGLHVTENIRLTFENQILNNADQICQCLQASRSLPSNEKDQLLSLVENMIRAPLRRQMGRLKSAIRSLEEADKKINSL